MILILFDKKKSLYLSHSPQALINMGTNFELEYFDKDKAEFIVDRAAEGYNNFLFADDQVKNVKAVDNVLSNLDVKGKTYQVNQKFSLGILCTSTVHDAKMIMFV